MNCKTCNKPIKENTDGNKRYCQGHSFFDTHFVIVGANEKVKAALTGAIKEKIK